MHLVAVNSKVKRVESGIVTTHLFVKWVSYRKGGRLKCEPENISHNATEFQGNRINSSIFLT